MNTNKSESVKLSQNMNSVSHPLAQLFLSTFILKRDELLARNSDKLALCDEEKRDGIRVTLLYNEYYLTYSNYSKEKYTMEFLDTFNSHRKTYAKGNIDTWIRLTKEEMLRMSMGEYRQVKEWTDRPDEELISAIAIYAAWNDIIFKHKNSEILEAFTEPEVEQPTEIYKDGETQAISNENQNSIKNTPTEPLTISETPANDPKITKRVKRKTRKTPTGTALSKMVIKPEYMALLEPLHKHLNKRYIEAVTFKDFCDNFDGKTSKEKFNWIATQYEFIYLFDKLDIILDKRLYYKQGSVKLTELLLHFTFNKTKIPSSSLRVARARIKKHLNPIKKTKEKDYHEMKTNIEALVSIIEELKQQIEELKKTS